MYIDFAINDTEINDAEAKLLIESINRYSINSVTVPYYLLRAIKSVLKANIELSCFIDYPLGISDSKTRFSAVEQAFKCGVNSVDVAMPQNLAANRKYDKIRDDIKNINDFCKENTMNLKYILEYRMFDHHCLKKICEIFDDFNIQYVYPSTGYFIDNLADNILASIFLHSNSKNLNVICSGNIWSEKHFETMIKSGLFGFRTNSIHTLKNFAIFNSIQKNN